MKSLIQFDVDKFQRIRVVTEALKIMNGVLNEVDASSEYKFELMKVVFEESGISLPKENYN